MSLASFDNRKIKLEIERLVMCQFYANFSVPLDAGWNMEVILIQCQTRMNKPMCFAYAIVWNSSISCMTGWLTRIYWHKSVFCCLSLFLARYSIVARGILCWRIDFKLFCYFSRSDRSARFAFLTLCTMHINAYAHVGCEYIFTCIAIVLIYQSRNKTDFHNILINR